MQQLSVKLNIQVPENFILVEKVEYEKLKDNELKGVYWNMKDLEKKTNRKHEWIKENILYPPRFRKMLDVKNGGFVYYPESKGQVWAFKATEMAKFLEDYFIQIFS